MLAPMMVAGGFASLVSVTPSRSNALRCSLVGHPYNRGRGGRCFVSSWRDRQAAALRRASGEGLALAMGEARCASCPIGSFSSYSMDARLRRMCHSR
jgi:hypothetical protein